ncbi:CDP-glycerol glycerophosphotransferase family protein, partial [Escherichia coli]|nr:CDP-glycerol glycerophosphotransferase family protein [Escherichia coli]
VCQTLFFKIEVFVKTKILMIQYGYAKEPHNYGAWRALGDLCLTYGDYASKKISYFCPSVSIGNPRYDKWHNIINNTLPSQNKDVSLKKILYAPTWGDLSSIDNYLNDIIALSENYVVMLKLHHNTDCLESYIKRKIDNRIYCYGANDDILDLINESDIVISDYSGAIFDAVYFKKPIILLNKEVHYDNNGKIDSFSIEYARRSELGYEVNNPEELFYAVQYVLNNKEYFSSMHASLRNELFLDNGRSIELAIKAIYDLHSGIYKINQQQAYIRAMVKDLLITKRKFKKLIIK